MVVAKHVSVGEACALADEIRELFAGAALRADAIMKEGNPSKRAPLFEYGWYQGYERLKEGDLVFNYMAGASGIGNSSRRRVLEAREMMIQLFREKGWDVVDAAPMDDPQ